MRKPLLRLNGKRTPAAQRKASQKRIFLSDFSCFMTGFGDLRYLHRLLLLVEPNLALVCVHDDAHDSRDENISGGFQSLRVCCELLHGEGCWPTCHPKAAGRPDCSYQPSVRRKSTKSGVLRPTLRSTGTMMVLRPTFSRLVVSIHLPWSRPSRRENLEAVRMFLPQRV